MNEYEGMIIFPEDLNEEALDEAVGAIKAEIERQGGRVTSTIRLGKRNFARPMDKQKSGHYAVLGFEMEGAGIALLHERLKLMPQVFRAQVLKAETPEPVVAAGGESAEEKSDGGVS